MYTSIRHYNVMPDSVNEVIRRAVEGFVPVISRARGFLGYDLVNTGNDTITTITTFDSEITALHSNTLAKSWDDENLFAHHRAAHGHER